jgi:hypothetical protein
MENFIASGILIGILGALAWIYLSIHLDTKAYIKKVKKYEKISLYSLVLRNRRKKRGS